MRSRSILYAKLLYSYSGRNLSDEELRNFASDMRREFMEWHESLPEELVVNLHQGGITYLPHVLQLQLAKSLDVHIFH